MAHSGDTTANLLEDQQGRPSQISQLPEDTNVVMFTVGGNDVKFAEIVSQCFALGIRDPKSCRNNVEAAQKGLSVVRDKTEQILNKIDARLPDGAQVILVGYPRLATDRKYILNEWGQSYDAGTNVRALSDQSRQVQSDLVRQWNASHPGLKVTYIDGVVNAFDGHEPDPSAFSRNPHRWINEFLETNGRQGPDGTTISESSYEQMHWYHPNLIGHAQIAELIKNQVGVPSPGNTDLGVTKGDIDIAFVIDSTGSMRDDVDAVRSRVHDIVTRVQKSASSYRFALVDYKDHPKYDSENYLAKTRLDFTSDGKALEDTLGTLTYEGGNIGNVAASSHSGVMQALGLKWRDGVRKIVIVIGDAPPRDPETETGYTSASVAKAAWEVDPAVVYGIDTGGLSSAAFKDLVDRSGGTIAESASPDNVATLINQAIESELSKPFAWIQGPYVIKVGDSLTLDARGSYATSGTITSYEWDFDGDGTYDQTTTEAKVTHTFPSEMKGYLALRVTQTDGQTNVATTPIMVTDDEDSTPAASDNCPTVYNYSQSDYDQDGIGDECDPEPGYPQADKPGVTETTDNQPAPVAPTSPSPSATATPSDSTQAPSPTATSSPSGVVPQPAPTAGPANHSGSNKALSNTGVSTAGGLGAVAALLLAGFGIRQATLRRRRLS
ncbi:Lipase precursor [Actinomyces bovis]|uniref:Lipase n=1 Tax=Actinomyces bovis TaxID=1658 RepID=A0ABY1VQU5_9ACTO|nr:Lipase precursor [Actinomyces bovis]VEG56206.1 Lipase precursor [Actinomyces israelii]